MNNIVIHGRISQDIEMRVTNTGKEVVNFSVAVKRRFDKETSDFFNCQAWEKNAAFINKYFKKGQEIIIQGAMQCRKWQDKDGGNRYSWELIVEQTDFCGSKSDNVNSQGSTSTYSASSPASYGAPPQPAQNTYEQTGFTAVPAPSDDDLPFN